MFNFIEKKFGTIDSIEIENKQLGIRLQILHGFGAIINALHVNNSPFSFIQGYSSADELRSTNPFFSRSAKLFPFPNRLEYGQYRYNQQLYQLPANFPWSEHAVHGLLYNQPFQLVENEASSSQATVLLRYESPRLHNGYPFSCCIDIRYTIDNNGQLLCHTQIKNTGAETFPFGDAWHPYFNLGVTLEHCQMTMPICQRVIHKNELPTDITEPYEMFKDGNHLNGYQFNDCFLLPETEHFNILIHRNDGRAKIEYQQDLNYRYIQLYTPPSESTLAIEPMTCPANAFNNQMGLLHLAPGQSRQFEWQCRSHYQS